MYRSLFAITFATLALSYPFKSTAGVDDIDYSCLMEQFTDQDANGDMQLESTEFIFTSYFDDVDINADGVISLGEFFIAGENYMWLHDCFYL